MEYAIFPCVIAYRVKSSNSLHRTHLVSCGGRDSWGQCLYSVAVMEKTTLYEHKAGSSFQTDHRS